MISFFSRSGTLHTTFAPLFRASDWCCGLASNSAASCAGSGSQLPSPSLPRSADGFVGRTVRRTRSRYTRGSPATTASDCAACISRTMLLRLSMMSSLEIATMVTFSRRTKPSDARSAPNESRIRFTSTCAISSGPENASISPISSQPPESDL